MNDLQQKITKLKTVYTIQEIADKTGVSHNTIHRVKNGNKASEKTTKAIETLYHHTLVSTFPMEGGYEVIDPVDGDAGARETARYFYIILGVLGLGITFFVGIMWYIIALFQ